ncbi:MAG: toxin-antitoxin system YwqK family antitoxin [Saprospiraceae bacterium]|nr:toxin-antitoxin system YwqK family antitoxin [Saprospiraceae bacterium]
MKAKLIPLLLIAFVWLNGCKEPYHMEVDANGKIVSKFQYQDSIQRKHGEYIKYFENGQVFERARYQDGKLDGTRYLFFDNGDISTIEIYKDGMIDSIYKEFFPGVKIKRMGSYINGKMKGKWQVYYPIGTTKEIVFFEDNLENGPFVEYYENGFMKAKGQYKNGDNEDGDLYLYRPDGSFERKMNCQLGICRTVLLNE